MGEDQHHCVSLSDIKLSDSVLMPKQFTGRASADGNRVDPENWLIYFNRYCDYKRLDNPSRATLFSVFLIDRSADWYLTLPDRIKGSFEELTRAFLENYGKTKEHHWLEAKDLFSKPQAMDESVSEFLVRLRKAGERIQAGEEMVNYAFLGGLRGPIRTHVLQQGVGDLEKSLAAARIAEASLSTDPLTSLLQEQIRVSKEAAEAQSTELKQLANKVAMLSEQQVLAGVNAHRAAPLQSDQGASEGTAHSRPQCQHCGTGVNVMAGPENFGGQNTSQGVRPPTSWPTRQPVAGARGQPVRPTPRNIQRANYPQQSRQQPTQYASQYRQNQSYPPMAGQQRQQPDPNQTGPPIGQHGGCNWCGLNHAFGRDNCRAATEICRRCGLMGHYARVCRSSRTAQN